MDVAVTSKMYQTTFVYIYTCMKSQRNTHRTSWFTQFNEPRDELDFALCIRYHHPIGAIFK